MCTVVYILLRQCNVCLNGVLWRSWFVVVCVQDVVLPLTKSKYFDNNPGSLERIPKLSALLGTFSVTSAAQGVLDAIESGEDVYTYSWMLYFAMCIHSWTPAVTNTLTWLTGWTLASPATADIPIARP